MYTNIHMHADTRPLTHIGHNSDLITILIIILQPLLLIYTIGSCFEAHLRQSKSFFVAVLTDFCPHNMWNTRYTHAQSQQAKGSCPWCWFSRPCLTAGSLQTLVSVCCWQLASRFTSAVLACSVYRIIRLTDMLIISSTVQKYICRYTQDGQAWWRI